jgi:hypothetical protein
MVEDAQAAPGDGSAMNLEEGGEAPMQQEAEDASGEGAYANLKRPRHLTVADADADAEVGPGTDEIIRTLKARLQVSEEGNALLLQRIEELGSTIVEKDKSFIRAVPNVSDFVDDIKEKERRIIDDSTKQTVFDIEKVKGFKIREWLEKLRKEVSSSSSSSASAMDGAGSSKDEDEDGNFLRLLTDIGRELILQRQLRLQGDLTVEEEGELDLAMAQIFSSLFRLGETDFVSPLAVQLMLSMKGKIQSHSVLTAVGRAIPGGISNQFIDASLKAAVNIAVQGGVPSPSHDGQELTSVDCECAYDNNGMYTLKTETGSFTAHNEISVWTNGLTFYFEKIGNNAKNLQQDIRLQPRNWKNKFASCPTSLFEFASGALPLIGDYHSIFIYLVICTYFIFHFHPAPRA